MSGGSTHTRIVAVLDLFTEARPAWRPDEMMAELGLSRPTLYRYLRTLRDAGLVASDAAGTHTLGPRVVEMDYLARRSDPLLSEGGPVLDALAASQPCTALLVRWYGDKLLCVDSRCSQDVPLSSYPRGRPMPLARGAISRAILAHLDRRQMMPRIERHLDELRELGLGQTAPDIARSLRAVRKAGTAVAFGEVTPGVVGIAAPVFDAGQPPVAALCMTVAADSVDAARIETLRASVRRHAATLGERIASQSFADHTA